MDQIAEFLIEKETITGKEVMQIFRKCKGMPEPEEKTASPEGFSVTEEEEPRPAEPEALHSGNEEEGQSKPLTDTDGWIPVSYTHLDVYKRQTQDDRQKKVDCYGD